MPMYHYEATDRNGKSVVGSMDASSEGAVRTRLLGMGYQATLVEQVVRDIKPSRTSSAQRRPITPKANVTVAVNARSLGQLYRQMATLLDSAVPITDALVRIRGMARGYLLRTATQDMLDTVNAGRPLSEAMARHPRVFSAGHVGMIQAGEQGGVLGRAFAELANQAEADWGVQSAIRFNWMLLYVRYLVIPMAAGIGWLLWNVMPHITAGTTPSIDRLLSQTLVAGLVALVGINLVIPLLFRLLRFTPIGALLESIAFSLPGLGARRKRVDRVKTLGSLASALDAGVPVAVAWQLASEAADSPFTRKRLLSAKPNLLKGSTVSEVMAQTGIYDRSTLDLAQTGEAAGKLPESLRQAIAFQREEANRIGSVTPMLIGMVVLFVVLAGLGYLIVHLVSGTVQTQVYPFLNDAP
ncbi:MAG TPA: type II secretion system F family protein [Armatimonadota bacterium]|nr:type II secretion system F family protein [Armatimonadota bacterium]